MPSILKALPAAAMLALAACGSANYADVVRFHTNQPISRGTLALVPADPAVANSLEWRTHAETVAVQMRRVGYTTGLPQSQVQYIATVDITQADAQGNVTRPGLPAGAPVTSGLGANVAVPTQTGRRNRNNRTTTLSVQIQRTSDRANIWEGRATKEVAANAEGANATNAVPQLAEALFRDFPGPTGKTTQVRLP